MIGSHGAALSPWRLTLAVAAIGLALEAQQRTVGSTSSPVGWLLFACSAVLTVLAAPPTLANGDVAPRPSARAEPQPGMFWVIGWGAAALVAVTLTTILSSRNQLPAVTVLLWMAACAFGAVALTGRRVTAPVRAAIPWSFMEIMGLAAVLVVALAARVSWIDTLPPYFFADEPRVGMFVRTAFGAPQLPNFFTMGWNTWPMVGISLQSLFAPLLGLRTGTLRLASALFGTLAVGTTYLMTRELFTRRTAVFAAVLFAIGRTAIDFSRLGVCHAQVMLFETLAFFAWWYGVNTGRAMSYWWAGVGLGLCLYTYNAGEVAPLLWAGWVVISVVVSPRAALRRWRGALITLVAFVLTTFPWISYATDHFSFGPNWGQWTIMARNRQILGQALTAWHAGGVGAAWGVLERQIRLTWLGFGVIPAGAYGLGYRGGGILDHVSAPLFVLGLALSLTRLLRQRGGFVVYWWLVTVIVGGVFTIDPPAVVRLVGVLPAVAVLGAVALETLLRVGESVSVPAVVRCAAGPAFAGVLLLVAGWMNWQTYFVAFARAPIDDTSELARWVGRAPHDAHTWLLGAEHPLHFTHDVNCEIFAFEYPERHLADVPDPAHFFPVHESADGPINLVLGPSQATLAPYIQALYPHSVVEDAMYGTERLLFRVIHLQTSDLTARTGLQAAEYIADGGVIETRVADPFDPGDTSKSPDHRVLWTGGIYWPTDKPAAVRIKAVTTELDAPVVVRIGDAVTQRFAGGGVADVQVTLPRGWQPFRIDAPSTLQGFSMVMPTSGHAFTRWDLRPEDAPEGLIAVYERDGVPIAHAIDPQINAFAVDEFFRPPHMPTLVQMPFTVTWQGLLRVATPGLYEFRAVGSGPYSISLDGQTLAAAQEVVPEQPRAAVASRTLDAGLHPIAAWWDSRRSANTTRRLFQLFWRPPGGSEELIPPSNFVPQRAQ